MSSTNSVTSAGAAPVTTMNYRPRFLDSTTTEFDIVTKAIIIGDSSVGKSSLLYRYTDSDWNPHYIATIGVDFKVLTFERDGKVIKLQLWDTAGQDRFKTITHTYYRGTHGVMLVFDVTNRESFDHVLQWLEEFHQFGGQGIPMVLVGNKADLKEKVVVSFDEATALAEQMGCHYVQTSAKSNQSVDDAFKQLTELCVAQRMKQLRTAPGPRDPNRRPIVVPHRRPVGGEQQRSGGCPCS